jgi:hypothetical protein
MASVTITIPDAQLTRVLDGIAGYHGYDSGAAQPGETKAAFAKRKLIEDATNWVRSYEQGVAVATATASVNSGVTLS